MALTEDEILKLQAERKNLCVALELAVRANTGTPEQLAALEYLFGLRAKIDQKLSAK